MRRILLSFSVNRVPANIMKWVVFSGLLYFSACGLASCNIIQPNEDPVTYGDTYIPNMLRTDKSCYSPGQQVTLSINSLPESSAVVRYKHLGQTLSEHPLTALQWTWQPPNNDFCGYMAEIHGTTDDKRDTVYAAIGIDVSSDPARFPRNGFLSKYDKMTDKQINAVIDDLCRYHINYVQFQDWHWKHHRPLAGTAAQPMDVWTDIISRNCYRSTVDGYIRAAHNHGMATLFYNLAYGVLEDYENDGVSREWLIYTDKNHSTIDVHSLSSPFKSSIYLANPGNADWQAYLRQQNDEVYSVFDFDGWQIDQLGGRGSVYDYNGNSLNLEATFGQFINNEKSARPDKRLVMNAVGQFGQQNQIATAPVDFCYTEVWNHSNSNGYTIFSDILTNNAEWSSGKQTVLAAYLNYNHGRSGRGLFNTPGVLMATAAASVWGGTILQLGEHMLCNEYFPNNNLSMNGELKRAMIRYYDFAVAYENLLRPDVPAGGINSDWFGVDVTTKDDRCKFNQWGPKMGQIATVGRHVGNRDVIHLLSYRNATHLDWCDTDANQGAQTMINDLTVSFNVNSKPNRVWVASPDWQHATAEDADWEYNNGTLTITVPALQYWTMIVIEQ